MESPSEATGPQSLPGPGELADQKTKINVSLKGVAETLVIPLAARAFDAATQKPILGDVYARDVLDKLDYNIDKMTLPPSQCASVALRTRQFDRWTASFLVAHPRSTVLHLACGLDSRAQRVQWSSDIRWIDVDLPDVIALRRQVLPQEFTGRDYQLVGASVTDNAWLDDIPADRPTIVVMEGLLSYLMEEDVTALLSRIADKFTEGELLFECVNAAVLSSLRKGRVDSVTRTGAQFHWAVEDPRSLQNIHPHLEMIESISFAAAPGVEELPLFTRISMYFVSWVPLLRDSVRFVRYGFGPRASE